MIFGDKGVDLLDAPLERFSDIELIDFCRVLRFFTLNKEPASLNNLVASLMREPCAQHIGTQLRDLKERFSTDADMRQMALADASGSVTPTLQKIFNIYLYGEYFHNYLAENAEYKRIQLSHLEPIVYCYFLHALIRKVNVIMELRKLLGASDLLNVG